MKRTGYPDFVPSLSPEHRLLFLLSWIEPPTGIGPELTRAPFDWDAFHKDALLFANVGLVASHLVERGPALGIPAEVVARFHRHRGFLELQAKFLLNDLKTLAARFDKEGLRYIALKGPVLAHLYYPSPGLRNFLDLDILIDRADNDAALRAVLDAGYRVGRTEPDELALIKPMGVAGVNLSIELHYHLVNFIHFDHYRDSDRLVLEDLWSRRVHRDVGGSTTSVFCPEDQIIYSCLHHFYHHRFTGMRYFSDMDAMLGGGRHTYDWERFLRILGGMRVANKMFMAFTCYEALFGKAAAPPDVMRELKPGAVRRSLAFRFVPDTARIPFTVFEKSFHLQKILALDRFRDMLRVVIRWLFPGRAFLEHFFSVKPADWSAKYFIIYPWAIVKKGIRRVVFRRPPRLSEIKPWKKGA